MITGEKTVVRDLMITIAIKYSAAWNNKIMQFCVYASNTLQKMEKKVFLTTTMTFAKPMAKFVAFLANVGCSLQMHFFNFVATLKTFHRDFG